MKDTEKLIKFLKEQIKEAGRLPLQNAFEKGKQNAYENVLRFITEEPKESSSEKTPFFENGVPQF